jgi:AcrR family transcriptional regulator
MTLVSLRDRKKSDTRSRIVREASALFAARGVAGVTVDEIARAADVGKGTVYNYFAAKEDIVTSFLIEIDRDALEAMALLPAPRMSAGEALERAGWSLLEHKAPHRDFVRAFLARTFASEGFVHELTVFQSLLDDALGGLFDRLIAASGKEPSQSIPDLILSFKTMHLGLSALWAIEGPPFATARMLMHRHMALLAKEIE